MVGVWHTTQKYWSTLGDATARESTEKVRWPDDQQFLISEQSGLTPAGWISKVLIISWNVADRQIHVVEVSQGGASTDLTLWFEGDVEKVSGYSRFGERLVRTELTVEPTSPDEYKFHMDCLETERAWVCSEGVSKRAK